MKQVGASPFSLSWILLSILCVIAMTQSKSSGIAKDIVMSRSRSPSFEVMGQAFEDHLTIACFLTTELAFPTVLLTCNKAPVPDCTHVSELY